MQPLLFMHTRAHQQEPNLLIGTQRKPAVNDFKIVNGTRV